MPHQDCPREADILDAVASQRWPDRLDDGLRMHVAECAGCADLGEVSWAIVTELESARAETAAMPPAALVWWRAQARARAEAARQAARPIAVMQALGLAGAAALVSLLIGGIAVWVWTRAEWLQALPAADPVALDAMGFAIRGTLLAVGFWLVLAPVAVYLAASED